MTRPIPIPLKFRADPTIDAWAQEVVANPPLKTITDDYQVEDTDHTIIADTSLQAIVATLPLAAKSVNALLWFKCSGVNSLTLDSNGEDIDGTPDMILADTEGVVIQNDGTQWFILASH